MSPVYEPRRPVANGLGLILSSDLPEDESHADDTSGTDRRLLLSIQQGDEQALAELILRYQNRLYQLTLRVCGDASLAEEATVESFYKVWRKAQQWQDGRNPGAWIYRIAVRTVLDLKRSQRRWRNRLQRGKLNQNGNSVPDLVEQVVEVERHERISHELGLAIDTLKDVDRVLVHLFYFEDRGLREIAPVLGATPDALKMRLARARTQLRQVLKEFDDEQASG